MFALAVRGGAMVHGAGAGINGKGLVFTGHADAGKSTLSSLFKTFGFIQPISDERVILRPSGKGYRMYGSPWHSDAKIAENLAFPLGAVFFIQHGNENRFIPCPPDRAVRQLIPQLLIPWYAPEKVALLLDVCGGIVESVPAYDFYFRPDRSAVEAVLKFSETV
jgi:hypothetical protein